MYNIIYKTSRQSRFDARYWMLGAGALGRPRGLVRGGREGSGWGTHVYLIYLAYMQSTSCKMLGWMKHKLESRLQREISITLDMLVNTTLMAESKEELKSLFMRMKEESEKAG